MVGLPLRPRRAVRCPVRLLCPEKTTAASQIENNAIQWLGSSPPSLSGETTGPAERSDQVFHLTVGARSPDLVLASL
jgi:hypothetical protein